MHHSAGSRDRSECDKNEAPMRCRSGGKDQRSRASHVHIRASWACSVLSCARVWEPGQGMEERCVWKPFSGELKEAYRCAGGCQGRGAVQRGYVRRPSRAERLDRSRRPRRSWRRPCGDGTNSIGGFSFGLHGYGGLSCNGNPCGVLPCAYACRRYQPCKVVVVVGG